MLKNKIRSSFNTACCKWRQMVFLLKNLTRLLIFFVSRQSDSSNKPERSVNLVAFLKPITSDHVTLKLPKKVFNFTIVETMNDNFSFRNCWFDLGMPFSFMIPESEFYHNDLLSTNIAVKDLFLCFSHSHTNLINGTLAADKHQKSRCRSQLLF
jgi:hypothetical protein